MITYELIRNNNNLAVTIHHLYCHNISFVPEV